MKIRMDFVTNSSSSSFIIARKEKLTEEQKAAILRFIQENFLGKLLLSPDSTEDEIKAVIANEALERKETLIREALKTGKSIYQGCVVFDAGAYGMADLFQGFWTIFSEADGENFTQIDTELDG